MNLFEVNLTRKFYSRKIVHHICSVFMQIYSWNPVYVSKSKIYLPNKDVQRMV